MRVEPDPSAQAHQASLKEAQRHIDESCATSRPLRLDWASHEETKYPFSDWIIRVRREGSKLDRVEMQGLKISERSLSKTNKDDEEFYFVHRTRMAIGERGSDYFFQLFIHAKSTAFTGVQRGECCLVLSDIAADAFPLLLDFVYYEKLECSIEIPVLVGLFSLSDYLRMDELKNMVHEAIIGQMNSTMIPRLFEHATALKQLKLCDLVVNYLRNNLMSLKEDSPVLTQLSTKQFLGILGSPAAWHQPSISCHVSNLVARFYALNADTISEEDFYELTDFMKMPRVSLKAAPVLYELAERFNSDCLKGRCTDARIQWYEQSQHPLSSNPDALAFLQRRGDVAVEVLGSIIVTLQRKTQFYASTANKDPRATLRHS